jgi:lipopolysaccharide biosynthesis glycosyltransferase
MNLERWRREDISRRVFEYLRTHRAIIQLNDQEAMNAVLWDDWGKLDYRWNWQIIWRGYRIGTHRPTWTPPTSNKSIIHFITAEKPWLPGCDYEERRFFYEYLDRTAWAGWRVSALQELAGRTRRTIGDGRNALGRLRRWLIGRAAGRTG